MQSRLHEALNTVTGHQLPLPSPQTRFKAVYPVSMEQRP